MTANSKLFVKSFLLWLPVAVLVLLPLLLLYKSGELLSLDAVIERQQKDHSLVGLAYSEPNPQYKFLTTVKLRPQILALGSSRVMQFRDYFFTEPFYNAGGAVAKIVNFEAFLRGIPDEQKPKVVIVGLDQYSFNANWDNMRTPPANFVASKSFLTPHSFADTYPNHHQNMLYDALSDIVKGKVNLKTIFSYKGSAIGLQAIVNGDGYLPDGSYLYTKEIKNPSPSRFENIVERINAGTAKFEYGEEVNQNALVALKSLLRYTKEKDVYVVAFLPPYAQVALEKMEESGKYGYIEKLPKELFPIFQSYNYPFFDFTNISSVGSSDKEAIDGFHGSDVTYLRILINMAEREKTLSQYVDQKSLKELLKNRESDFIVRP